MAAVYELSTVRPHEPDDAKFTRADYAVYTQGYYTALVYALRVMELALERWRLRLRARRQAAERRRAKLAGSVESSRVAGVKQVGVLLDELVDRVEQRDDQVQGTPQINRPLGDGVEGVRDQPVRARFAVDVPLEQQRGVATSHSAKYLIEHAQSQSPTEKAITGSSASQVPGADAGHPGGELVHRGEARERSRPRRKKITR